VAVTDVVVMGKVADVAPWGTETLPETGTCAAGLLLDSETIAPPAGAAVYKVTVPVEELPPTTELGATPTRR